MPWYAQIWDMDITWYIGEHNRIMERIRYVGRISRQGSKRMVIIPTEFHEKVTRIGNRQVHVDISLVYDDEGIEPHKRSKG